MKKNTLKNKIVALLLIIIGFLPVIFDNDATFLVIALFFAIPLFLSKNNYIL